MLKILPVLQEVPDAAAVGPLGVQGEGGQGPWHLQRVKCPLSDGQRYPRLEMINSNISSQRTWQEATQCLNTLISKASQSQRQRTSALCGGPRHQVCHRTCVIWRLHPKNLCWNKVLYTICSHRLVREGLKKKRRKEWPVSILASHPPTVSRYRWKNVGVFFGFYNIWQTMKNILVLFCMFQTLTKGSGKKNSLNLWSWSYPAGGGGA